MKWVRFLRAEALIAVLLMICFFQNCGYVGDSNPDAFTTSLHSFSAVPTYSEIFDNILQPKCVSCHDSGLSDFSSYASLMNSGDITPFNPNSSVLYQKIAEGLMPKNAQPLSSDEVRAVYAWIAAGALNGSTPPTPPEAPSNLSAVAISASGIMLSWTLPPQTLLNLKIERASVSNGTYAIIANIGGTETSYSDAGLTASTTYYYRISGSNAVGPSPVSIIANASTQAPPLTAPTTPNSLVATAISDTQINLTWMDQSSNESNFKVERATSAGGPYSILATVAANTTSYSSVGLTAATTYYYRVSSTNTAGSSSPTSVASASTLAAPQSNSSTATFTWIKANVLPKCTSCHGGSNPSAGRNYMTYAGVMQSVVANQSARSGFYTKINSGSMPKGGTKLPPATITNIKNWIDSGALNN